MPEKNDEVSPEEEVTIEEHSFDELARGVADGNLSRGKALKAVGVAFLGGLASLFALPPREAEAGKLSTLWAVVAADGTLVNGKGAVLADNRFDLTNGDYLVKFNRNVRNCAYSVTTTGGFAGQTGAQPYNVGGAEAWVEVFTTNSAGTAADIPFYLVVNC
jgi:hypothetical protein